MMMDENGMEIVKKRSGLLGFLLIKKERTSIVVLCCYVLCVSRGCVCVCGRKNGFFVI
jgi:hypothetical protein